MERAEASTETSEAELSGSTETQHSYDIKLQFLLLLFSLSIWKREIVA